MGTERAFPRTFSVAAGIASMAFVQTAGAFSVTPGSLYSYLEVGYHTDYHEGREPRRTLAELEATDGRLLEDSGISESIENPVGETLVEGGAAVSTDFGKHIMYADLNVSDGHLNTFWSNTYSVFEEYVVFECVLCGASEGSAIWGVTVHGEIDAQGGDPFDTFANFGYELRLDSEYLVDLDFSTRTDGAGNYAGTEYFPVEFEFGREYRLQSTAFAEAFAGNYEEGFSGRAYADFSRTIALTVVDLPPGVTMVTGSGTQYPVDYTFPAVPVPPALLLATAPVLILLRRG